MKRESKVIPVPIRMKRIGSHRHAGECNTFVRSATVTQHTRAKESIKRIVGVECDAPVGMKLRAIILTELQINVAQHTMAAAVALIQHECSTSNGKRAFKFSRRAANAPLCKDCQSQIGVSRCVLRIKLHCLFK